MGPAEIKDVQIVPALYFGPLRGQRIPGILYKNIQSGKIDGVYEVVFPFKWDVYKWMEGIPASTLAGPDRQVMFKFRPGRKFVLTYGGKPGVNYILHEEIFYRRITLRELGKKNAQCGLYSHRDNNTVWYLKLAENLNDSDHKEVLKTMVGSHI